MTSADGGGAGDDPSDSFLDRCVRLRWARGRMRGCETEGPARILLRAEPEPAGRSGAWTSRRTWSPGGGAERHCV
jgi:hypothetical protein